MIKYIPILKTMESEMRGYRFLDESIKRTEGFLPLFELTKPRRPRGMAFGNLEDKLQKLAEIHPLDSPFILDITTYENLSTPEINELLKQEQGYCRWISFIRKQKERFPQMIPCFIVSSEETTADEACNNLSKELQALNQLGRFAYRIPVEGIEYLLDDMQLMKDCNITMSDVIVILDMGFIGTGIPSDKIPAIENILRQIYYLGVVDVAICSSSFLKNPAETTIVHSQNARNEVEEGSVKLLGYKFYTEIQQKFENSDIIYGDYATIYPRPSLQEGSRGWIPRIDLPTQQGIHFFRQRKDQTHSSYGPAYQIAAERVAGFQEFPKYRNFFPNCWGLQQIQQAADGVVPGRNPSFWISVRVNIYITEMLHALMNPEMVN